MIDYEDLLYEDYKKLIHGLYNYNKHFLSKRSLEKIRFRLRYGDNITSGYLTIITTHNEILTKNIRISNMPPIIEIKITTS